VPLFTSYTRYTCHLTGPSECDIEGEASATDDYGRSVAPLPHILAIIESSHHFAFGTDTMAFQTLKRYFNKWFEPQEMFTERYSYSPLQHPSNIRLVSIRKEVIYVAPYDTEVPSIRFIEVSLDKTPKYEALSYEWGKVFPAGPPRSSIRCTSGGQFIPVTRNLHDAIKHLCPKERYSKRLMWIDALCIDQDNIDERNAQVQLMSQIYQNAACVLVWLGPPADDSELAVRFLACLAEMFRKIRDPSQYQAMSRAIADQVINNVTALTTKNRVAYCTEGFTPWRALAKLMRRGWFTRVWIIQEVLLARKLVVVCGMHQIPWENYALVAQHMAQHKLMSCLSAAEMQHPETGYPHGFATIIKLNEGRMRIQRGELYNLEDAFILSINSEATDPRDFIWALRGVSERDGHQSLIPNYHVPPEEVFTSTARHIIVDKSELDLLCFAKISDTVMEAPTWVPVWGGAVSRYPLFVSASEFHAAGQTEAHVYSLDADPTLIIVQGCHVDTVIALNSALPSLGLENQAYPVTSETQQLQLIWLTEATSLLPPNLDNAIYGLTEELMLMAFYRTIIAGQSDFSTFAAPALGAIYSLWQQFLCLPTGQAPEQIVRNHPLLIESWEQIAEFKNLFRQFTAGRRFGVTLQGYIGLLPATAEIGDAVVVFEGGRVPFVLRECEREEVGQNEEEMAQALTRNWAVIGDCYIHGIMDGEVMGWSEIRVESFNLK
jgi:hypothetical protein